MKEKKSMKISLSDIARLNVSKGDKLVIYLENSIIQNGVDQVKAAFDQFLPGVDVLVMPKGQIEVGKVIKMNGIWILSCSGYIDRNSLADGKPYRWKRETYCQYQQKGHYPVWTTFPGDTS